MNIMKIMKIVNFIKNIFIKLIIYLIFKIKKISFLNNFFLFKNLFYLYDIDRLIKDNLCWWTYSIQKDIENILMKYHVKNILEYGSGASTIFFAKKGYEITSIEYDQSWFLKIKEYLKSMDKTCLYYLPKDNIVNFDYISKKNYNSYKNYVFFPKTLKKKFDLIIIDGRAREKCLEISLSLLSPKGIIIFDDTERTRYKKSINNFLSENKFNEKKFIGLAPGSIFKNRATSLIFKY